LLKAEIELRRSIERVPTQRRALPPGGIIPENYRFEEALEGKGDVQFSELFAPGKDTLDRRQTRYVRRPTTFRTPSRRATTLTARACRPGGEVR
jgi:hypothetical protein